MGTVVKHVAGGRGKVVPALIAMTRGPAGL